MPEANKKDNFTFSDKIKNSKPGLSPFSKRVSSKVGNNGKPKKTLFERTKRDAPFFIAAAAALLMLPVLYKYSGQVNDAPIVPPQEGSVFDPERYGFGTLAGDPDGQIAQLSGRDPLSLIKGWGTPIEELDPYEPYDPSRDGIAGSTYPAPAPSTVTTIRNTAPAQTREAFSRPETKINPLGSASMATGRGNSPNVGRWGGSLKTTARRQSAYEPPIATKPVSLQPLRPAANRSYFGQGGAAEARRSAAAATKGNAMQALMDAQMRQVDPAKVGGLGFGGGRGGGGAGGQMKRDFNFTPITPWWWDLMKTRAQKEWELWFDQKAKLVNTWGDFLNNAFMCLLSGNDDNDMGTLFGTRASEAGASKCCGLTEKEWQPGTHNMQSFPRSKTICRGLPCYAALEQQGKKGWEGGEAASPGLNFIEQRLWCLSNGLFGGRLYTGAPGLRESSRGEECSDMPTRYSIKPEGKAMKWNRYHYVVARNYSPIDGGNNLCAKSSPLVFNRQVGSGVATLAADGSFAESVEERLALNEERANNASSNQAINNKKRKDNNKQGDIGAIKKENAGQQNPVFIGGTNEARNYNQQDIDSERAIDGCVIYVAQGDVFEWTVFKKTVVNRLKEIIAPNGTVNAEKSRRILYLAGGYDESYADASKKFDLTSLAEIAFEHLDLMFIESVAMKHPLTNRADNNRGKVIPNNLLPMNFYEFDQAYVQKRGTTADITKKRRQEVDKLKYREEGMDFVHGARCDFWSVNLFCLPNSYDPIKDGYDTKPTAFLTFTGAYRPEWNNISITAALKEAEGKWQGKGNDSEYIPPAMTRPQDIIMDLKKVYNQALTSTSPDGNRSQRKGKITFEGFGTGPTAGKEKDPGTVVWTMHRTDADPITIECAVNSTGDGRTPDDPVPAQQKENPPTIAAPDLRANLTANTVAINDTKVSTTISVDQCPTKSWYRTKSGQLQQPDTLSNIFINVLMDCDDCYIFVSQMAKLAVDSLGVDANSAEMLALQARIDKNQLKIADYLWALNVRIMANDKLGKNEGVSVKSLCQLVKQIGAISVDPHTINQDAPGQPARVDNSPSSGGPLGNVFGAVAVYIGLESSLYPGPAVNGIRPDRRFHGCQDGKAVGVGPNWHWGRYNSRGKASQAFASIVNRDGFPLKSLRRGNLSLGSSDATNRDAYVAMYDGLLSGAAGSCDYYGNKMVDPKEIQQYFDLLCINTLQHKPGNGVKTCFTGTATGNQGGSNRQNNQGVCDSSDPDC